MNVSSPVVTDSVTPEIDPLTSYLRALSASERSMLIGLSGVAPGTLNRIRAGKPVRPISRARVESAIRSLQARAGAL